MYLDLQVFGEEKDLNALHHLAEIVAEIEGLRIKVLDLERENQKLRREV